MLAVAPTDPWFPSIAIHAAWVGFDIALIGALRVQRRTGNARLARAIAIAVSLDALLTTVQAVWWNAPRAHHALEVIAMIVACAGPLIAAPVLWGAVRRLHAVGARLPSGIRQRRDKRTRG